MMLVLHVIQRCVTLFCTRGAQIEIRREEEGSPPSQSVVVNSSSAQVPEQLEDHEVVVKDCNLAMLSDILIREREAKDI